MEDWRRTGGAQVLTAQNVGAEFEEVLVGGRLALQHNITPFISSGESDRKEDFTFSLSALLLTGFPGYPGCPGCPGSPSCPEKPLGPTTPT